MGIAVNTLGKMEIVFILAGLLGGIGGTVGAYELFGEDVPPACTADFIAAHGKGLCRETIACNGNANAAGCDSVRNVTNSREIWDHCSKLDDKRPDPKTDSPREACFELYGQRK